MFEYYGWVVVRDTETNCGLSGESLRALQENVRVDFWHIENNGYDHVLFMTGVRNHRHEYAFDTLRWIALHLPGSYGLLYVQDDEDWRCGYHQDFRVWRLARGHLTEHADPFLSPAIPTVEVPFWGDDEDESTGGSTDSGPSPTDLPT